MALRTSFSWCQLFTLLSTARSPLPLWSCFKRIRIRGVCQVWDLPLNRHKGAGVRSASEWIDTLNINTHSSTYLTWTSKVLKNKDFYHDNDFIYAQKNIPLNHQHLGNQLGKQRTLKSFKQISNYEITPFSCTPMLKWMKSIHTIILLKESFKLLHSTTSIFVIRVLRSKPESCSNRQKGLQSANPTRLLRQAQVSLASFWKRGVVSAAGEREVSCGYPWWWKLRNDLAS